MVSRAGRVRVRLHSRPSKRVRRVLQRRETYPSALLYFTHPPSSASGRFGSRCSGTSIAAVSYVVRPAPPCSNPGINAQPVSGASSKSRAAMAASVACMHVNRASYRVSIAGREHIQTHRHVVQRRCLVLAKTAGT